MYPNPVNKLELLRAVKGGNVPVCSIKMALCRNILPKWSKPTRNSKFATWSLAARGQLILDDEDEKDFSEFSTRSSFRWFLPASL